MFSHDQYRFVRERAGMIDRSSRGKIVVAGADRASYLQGLLSNDIAALGPGAGCYATYLTPQGRLIADMHVVELGEGLLLDVHPDVKDRLVAAFTDLVFTEDVRIEDRSEAWALFGVHGPKAAAIVSGVVQADASGEPAASAEVFASLAEHHGRRAAFDATPLVIVATRELGVRGFDLYVDCTRARALWQALLDAGAVAIDPDAAEVLRIEAGRPAFLVDMDEDTIPLEAGIEDRAISLTKGCYVGQEIIVRVLHRGHGRVARRLVGLTIDAAREGASAASAGVPQAGDRIVSGGKEVGHVTSGCWSPALGAAIALGYVHRDYTEPGAPVEIAHGDARLAATVTALPFVKGGWGD